MKTSHVLTVRTACELQLLSYGHSMSPTVTSAAASRDATCCEKVNVTLKSLLLDCQCLTSVSMSHLAMLMLFAA